MWKAKHAECQKAVDNVKADLMAEIKELREKNDRLRTAVALLNSMILSGESHSDTSRAVMRAALDCE
jgi:FtsZ-binding cell division protein ZapB